MKIIILLGLLLIATCASNNKNPESEMQAVKNYTINSITEISRSPSKKSAEFLIKGILPSPAYSIKKIKISQQNDEINLEPVLEHDPNKIVIQMAIPFEKEVEVKNIQNSCKICIDGKTYIKSFSFKE